MFAADNSIQVLAHDEQISGRFSSFTAVSILPGLIAGLDMRKFCEGGQKILDDFMGERIKSHSARAGISLALFDKKVSVNVSYSDPLIPLLEWYAQMQAESLGKEGKGITPIKSTAPADHHSQLQLYLDGNRDKVFTLIGCENIGVDLQLYDELLPRQLKGKSMQDINKALF